MGNTPSRERCFERRLFGDGNGQEADSGEPSRGTMMVASEDGANAPLRIDRLTLPCGGTVGLTHCPGRNHRDAGGRLWARSLAADLAAVRAWPASMLVSLIEDQEFARLGVADLGQAARSSGLAWCHLPIEDMHPPGDRFEKAWRGWSERINQVLGRGEGIVLHCAGGLGRSGTVAALLLIDRGVSASDAIRLVRAARPGAIETASQEGYLSAYESKV